ncbi:tetratricopeptide repeat protein [Oerskovia sp. M15]
MRGQRGARHRRVSLRDLRTLGRQLHGPAAFGLARIRQARGDLDGALHALDLVTPTRSSYTDARMRRARLLAGSGRGLTALAEALASVESVAIPSVTGWRSRSTCSAPRWRRSRSRSRPARHASEGSSPRSRRSATPSRGLPRDGDAHRGQGRPDRPGRPGQLGAPLDHDVSAESTESAAGAADTSAAPRACLRRAPRAARSRLPGALLRELRLRRRACGGRRGGPPILARPPVPALPEPLPRSSRPTRSPRQPSPAACRHATLHELRRDRRGRRLLRAVRREGPGRA